MYRKTVVGILGSQLSCMILNTCGILALGLNVTARETQVAPLSSSLVHQVIAHLGNST